MQPDESPRYRIEPEQGGPSEPYWQNPSAYAHPAAYAPPLASGPPPGYGAPPTYGPPQPGWYWPPTPWNPPPLSTRWPHGPDRPGVATAAAVLGFVTAGLSLIAGIGFLIAQTTGDGDAATAVLLLGIPCAAAQIVGALQLMRRRGRNMLFLSALTAVVVLLGTVFAAAVALSSDDFGGVVIFVVFALPLPVLTAVFTALRTVSAWLAAGRAQPLLDAPHHI